MKSNCRNKGKDALQLFQLFQLKQLRLAKCALQKGEGVKEAVSPGVLFERIPGNRTIPAVSPARKFRGH